MVFLWLVYVGGSDIFVDPLSLAGGDGSSWDQAFQTVEAALTSAANTGGGNHIRLAQGRYVPVAELNGWELPEGVWLQGGFAGLAGPDPNSWDPDQYPSILDGDRLGNDITNNWPSHSDNAPTLLFYDNHVASARIQGFTIQGGAASTAPFPFPYNGCAVSAIDSELELVDLRFEEAFPAGNFPNCYVYFKNSQASVTRCVFNGLSLSVNAYLWSDNSQLELADSYFGSATLVGGGLSQMAGSLRVRDTVFENINASLGSSQGGGLRAHNAAVDLEGVIVRNCFANDGGGLYFQNCTGRVVFCLLENNHSASDTGGGITQHGGDMTFALCRFYNNLGEIAFGGGFALVSGTGRVVGCLFSRNMTSFDFPPTQFDRGNGIGVTSEGQLRCSLTTLYAHPLISGGGTVSCIWGETQLDRCILWSDESTPGVIPDLLVGENPPQGFIQVLESTVEGGSPGNPLGAIGLRPPFIDPAGPDNLPGTLDDNLRLSWPVPAELQSVAGVFPQDEADVDHNGITAEPFPLDLDGYRRFPANGNPISDFGSYQSRRTGDWDTDNHLTILDLLLTFQHLGACPVAPRPCPGDWNHSGIIDGQDLLWARWSQ